MVALVNAAWPTSPAPLGTDARDTNAHWARRLRVKRRRFWFVKALCVAAVVLFVPQVAWAGSYVAGPLVRVSGTSPFAGSNCGLAGQTGKNFLNSEVEPFVDVNPANGDNIIGAWQQDRSEERRVGKECRSRWSP